MEFNDSTVRDF
jgi:hypothetical protein